MTRRFTDEDQILGVTAVTGALDLHSCAELQTLSLAARAIEAEAEEQEFTRIDPVDLPGLRRAAQILRLMSATHVSAEHRSPGTCSTADASGGAQTAD